MLQTLGVSMGTSFHENRSTNPIGHFEDLEFLALNERVLEDACGDPTGHRVVPSREAVSSAAQAYSEDVAALIRSRSAKPIWGWKDPRTCLTLDLYRPYLAEPRYVVCSRDVEAVARSLQRRDNLPVETARKIKHEYDARIGEALAAHHGEITTTVLYENLMSDPVAIASHLATYCGVRDRDRIVAAADLVMSRAELVKAKAAARRRRSLVDGLTRIARVFR